MRKIIKKGLLISSIAAVMTGCDDNAWNDKLDGFEGNPPITDVQTIEYTLTAADYSAIASNTTNATLAGDNGAALKAIGTQQYFTEAMPASKYVPAFLASTSFPYFTLSDGSAIKVTYNVSVGLPEEINALASAKEYVVSDDDYVYAWDSDDNYVPAYTPEVSPAKNIPAVLNANFPDAKAGDYVIVNYNYSTQEPIFATVGGDTPDEFILSNVIASAAVGDNIVVNGIVTATCTSGLIVTDASGSIFFYFKDTTDLPNYKIGDQLVISAPVTSYNYGLQLAYADAEVETKGTQDVTYPTPTVLTGADFDVLATRSTNEPAFYAQFVGSVTNDGKYINFVIDGAEKAQGSPYSAPDAIKAMLTDGSRVKVTGYMISVSGKGKYINFVITNVEILSLPCYAPAAPVPSVNTNAVYTYNGSKWSEVKTVAILQPSDYTEMDQKYGNLSGTLPAELLPIYLAKKYPYAQADDSKYVLYKYYNGSSTSYRCDEYMYNGAEWSLNKGIETETSQFVRSGGEWKYDPSVTITLPTGRGQALSTLYYQTCVDWVGANVKDGKKYISSYGNNEYYCGTSAYQGNVDLRASAARDYGMYDDMSDDEIVELEKQRFAYQVMPGALAILHADAVPVEGVDVLYTINFGVYTGSTANYTIIYKVTAPKTFEMVSCDWWEGGEPSVKLDIAQYLN